MPMVSQRLLSQERLLKKRAAAERARVANGLPHQLHYFHQVDDPYSALVAACLPDFLARYAIQLVPHVVGEPPANAAPERDKLKAYSRRDAESLARHWGMGFRDPGHQPDASATQLAQRMLVSAIQSDQFSAVAGKITRGLWRGEDFSALNLPLGDAALAQAHVSASTALREQWGHYLGGMFFYCGEWYWGLDRLYHLEERLQSLGLQKPGVMGTLFAPPPDLQHDCAPAQPTHIDYFFSLRSPYSAIVTPRVFALGRHTGVPVRLRYLLPMVMRGLPVPKIKSSYIALDAAREARARDIAFGRVNDPVGKPTERGLALMPLAERLGHGQAYLLSFMKGVWAEGIDAGSDRGLRRIVERAGLSWGEAQDALQQDDWRSVAEANRTEMFGLGLWGVPSFRVNQLSVWGQDRLWAVQEEICGQRQKEAS